MLKHLWVLVVLLGLTACNERKTLAIPTQDHLMSTSDSQTKADHEIEKGAESDSAFIEVPILSDEKPSLPSQEFQEKGLPVSIDAKPLKHVGGTSSDGLDIADIRVSHAARNSRIVFDSYIWDLNEKSPKQKASKVGHYSYTYEPAKKRITLIVSGYRGFSALAHNKIRTYSVNPLIEKIYLTTYKDDSGFKCVIDLKEHAQVNVFDLKEPGRLVVDVSL